MEWGYGSLKKELLEKCSFNIENICNIARYDESTAKKVLLILLEWACYGQNEAGIKLGREKISEIPKKYLKKHLLNTVKHDFDYYDEWNYRRLLELVVELIPENKDEFIALNCGTENSELQEVMDDFA